jgi:hypothetical protein
VAACPPVPSPLSGGSHVLTTHDPAQRFKDAMRRPRSKRMGVVRPASRIGECELAYNDAGKEEEVPTGHAKLDTLRPERVRDIPPPGFTDMPTTD